MYILVNGVKVRQEVAAVVNCTLMKVEAEKRRFGYRLENGCGCALSWF